MNKIFPLQLSFVGCCLFCGVVWAQAPSPFLPSPEKGGEPIVSSDANAGTDKPVQAPRSSQSETILRAAKDLDHLEVGRRVGAAKLLGKYPGSQSAFILVAALDDSSPLRSPFGHGVFGRACFEWLSALRQIPGRESIFQLGDTDAEVRREVSTMIPRLVSGLGAVALR